MRKSICIILTIFLLSIILNGCGNKQEEATIEITEKYIANLFNNPSENLNLTRGLLKFNIANMPENTQYELIKIESETEFKTDKLCKIYSEISYKDKAKDEYDTVFYETSLLLEDDQWKIIHFDEIFPKIESKGNKKSNVKIEELAEVFTLYNKELENNNYENASKYLISLAKQMHNQASIVIENMTLVEDFKDLEGNIIYENGKVAIAQFNFSNKGKQAVNLVYFYLTDEQGWMIYNVKQL